MNLIKKEFLFFSFLLLSIILLINTPTELYNLNSYISWKTIRALIVLLLITTAIKISHLFDELAIKFIFFFKTEKSLAIFFVTITSFLAMFLTNDITLFIVVPITLALKNFINNDITKIVIFEAISANIGSMLTPIGNPQNLYLFRELGDSFFNFINMMLPIFIIQISILYLFTFINFPKNKLELTSIKNKKINYPLFIISFLFFIMFIFSLELNFVKFLLPIIIITFIFIDRQILVEFDYFLIFTFILMFIDFNIIAKFEFIKETINSINLNFSNVFNLSIIFSQIMSNVPATIFMSQFSHNYQAIAYGTNLAGTGFFLGSLANIIALRILNEQKIYITFHKYSIPYFIISYIAVLTYLTNFQ